MDGPVIQERHSAPSKGGVNINIIFDQARDLMSRSARVMCYYNTIHHAATRLRPPARGAGIRPAIVPDPAARIGAVVRGRDGEGIEPSCWARRARLAAAAHRSTRPWVLYSVAFSRDGEPSIVGGVGHGPPARLKAITDVRCSSVSECPRGPAREACQVPDG